MIGAWADLETAEDPAAAYAVLRRALVLLQELDSRPVATRRRRPRP